MKLEKYQQDKVMYNTTGCLLDYAYFKDNYKLIAADLRKQKGLDADPRAIQQIVSQGIVGGADNTKIRLYTILENTKEIVLEFYKGTAKVLWIIWMVEYSNVQLSNSKLNKLNCC